MMKAYFNSSGSSISKIMLPIFYRLCIGYVNNVISNYLNELTLVQVNASPGSSVEECGVILGTKEDSCQ